MKNYLQKLDRKFTRIIRAVGDEADKKGLSAYVVGGTVRDILLKKRNLDLDFTVEGDAMVIARTLAKKFKTRAVIHDQFKTASVLGPGGVRIDLATTRRESYRHPGALPTVKRGTIEDDLFRRDFTVNAMAICVNRDAFGVLVDLCGGLSDLRNKKIRVLHDKSFIDDPTRNLRAIRFEQRLGFLMERRTLQCLKRGLKPGNIAHVKPPRYFAEFKKLLSEDDPVKALKRLRALKGMGFLGAALSIPSTILKHIRLRLKDHPGLAEQAWLMYFLALIEPLNGKSRNRLINTFHFTREEAKAIRQAVELKVIMAVLGARNIKSSEVYAKLETLSEETVRYLGLRTTQTLVSKRITKYLNQDRHVHLKINGRDLKKAGISSGAHMGSVLKQVLYAKIDRRVRTKREELKKALESLGKQ